MKKLIAITLMTSLVFPVLAGGDGWHTSLTEAQNLAKKEGKPILMNFSGSDWCGWCIRLHKEVFSTDVFKQYAKNNLVLLELDFPKKKSLPETVQAQNKKLADKYGIRGFPTVIIIDASGKILLETGYRQGGSAAYVDFLKQSLHKS